jgi:hypothetical protein
MSLVDDYEAIRRAVEDLKREENPLKEVPDGVGLQPDPGIYASGPKGSLSNGSLEAAVNEAMEKLKEKLQDPSHTHDPQAPTPTAPTSYVRCYRWFLDRPNPALRMLPEVRKTSNRT